MLRLIGLSMLCLSLVLSAACTVTPLYGESNRAHVGQQLEKIAVDKIDSRLGYFTQQEVERRLNYKGGKNQYRLLIAPEMQRLPALLRQNEVAERFDYIATAEVELHDLDSSKPVHQFKTRVTISAFDSDSPYASLVVQKDVERYLGALLGEDIHDKLTLYFVGEAS